MARRSALLAIRFRGHQIELELIDFDLMTAAAAAAHRRAFHAPRRRRRLFEFGLRTQLGVAFQCGRDARQALRVCVAAGGWALNRARVAAARMISFVGTRVNGVTAFGASVWLMRRLCVFADFQ